MSRLKDKNGKRLKEGDTVILKDGRTLKISDTMGKDIEVEDGYQGKWVKADEVEKVV